METYIWLILIVAGIAVEAISPQLVSIWFVFGFVAAYIANLLGAGDVVQISLAILVSIVMLIATKPLVKKILTQKDVNTNADRNIGKIAVVTTEIPAKGVGRVDVAGASWSAYCEEDKIITVGTKVVVEKIEGVKLSVSIMEG